MNEEQLEKLGLIADSIDNILAACELPLGIELHLEVARESMKEWSEQIKALYQETSGKNPWDTLHE